MITIHQLKYTSASKSISQRKQTFQRWPLGNICPAAHLRDDIYSLATWLSGFFITLMYYLCQEQDYMNEVRLIECFTGSGFPSSASTMGGFKISFYTEFQGYSESVPQFIIYVYAPPHCYSSFPFCQQISQWNTPQRKMSVIPFGYLSIC